MIKGIEYKSKSGCFHLVEICNYNINNKTHIGLFNNVKECYEVNCSKGRKVIPIKTMSFPLCKHCKKQNNKRNSYHKIIIK